MRIGPTLLGVTGLQVIGRPFGWPRQVVSHCDLVAQLLVQAVRRTRDRGALAAIDARARRIAEYIPDGLLLLDRSGAINWASPSFIRTTGRSERELSGRPMADLVHDDDRVALAEAVDTGPFGGAGLVVRVAAIDGWRWTDVSWRLVQEADDAVPDELVVSLRDVHDLHLHTRELSHQNTHDSLTGLLNRAGLARAVTDLGPTTDLVVAFLDVDAFKAINDGHGHGTGDAVLVRIARCLEGSVRTSDLVARIGGDEFCVVTRDDAPAGLAERIVHAVRADTADASPVVSVSVGVAGPGPAGDLTDLQRRADEAMYRAKRAGGDGFAVCSQS